MRSDCEQHSTYRLNRAFSDLFGSQVGVNMSPFLPEATAVRWGLFRHRGGGEVRQSGGGHLTRTLPFPSSRTEKTHANPLLRSVELKTLLPGPYAPARLRQSGGGRSTTALHAPLCQCRKTRLGTHICLTRRSKLIHKADTSSVFGSQVGVLRSVISPSALSSTSGTCRMT